MKEIFANFLRRHSLKSVIVVYVLVFSGAALLLLKSVSNFFMSDIIMDNYLTTYMNSIYSSFEYTLSDMLKNINISSLNITTWPELYNIILNDEIENNEKESLVHQYTDEFLNNHNMIAALDIVTFDGKVYRNSKNGITLPLMPDSFMADIVPAEMSVYNKPIMCEKEYYIAIGTKCRDFYSGFEIGTLILYIPESSFYSVYQKSMLKDSSFFILADDYVISHSDKSMLGSRLFFPQNLHDKSPVVLANNVIGKYNIRETMLSTDISIVIMLSSDNLYKVVNRMKFFVYCIFAVVALISLLTAFAFTRKLLKQYLDLKGSISKFAHNPQKVVKFKTSNELAELEESFNVMANTINKMITDLTVAKEKQREAEIRVLQSQINPHFIYNALDTITCMAKIENQPRIEQTSYSLATFFRIGLSGGERLITLEKELKHAESYIQIQQMRFPGRFDVKFNIPENLLQCKILKITLQPLLENCVLHAFKQTPYKGEIIVTAKTSDDMEFIILTVADNGIGFSENPLFSKKDDRTYSGYGIYNVQQRLKLEYGDSCCLSYSLNEAGGTTATVKIKYCK